MLNPSTKPLPVRWSKEKGFYAENLFVVECEDAGDLEGVLDEGNHCSIYIVSVCIYVSICMYDFTFLGYVIGITP